MLPYIIVCTLLIILIICYYCFSPQNSTTKKIATRDCGCTKRSISRLPSKFVDIVTDPSDYYFTYSWNISTNTVVYTPYQDYRVIVRLIKSNSNVVTSTQIINSNNINIVPTSDANQTDFTLIYRKSVITPTTTYLDLLREIIITTTGNLSGSYIQIFDTSITPNSLISQSDIFMGGDNRNIITWKLTNNILNYTNEQGQQPTSIFPYARTGVSNVLICPVGVYPPNSQCYNSLTPSGTVACFYYNKIGFGYGYLDSSSSLLNLLVSDDKFTPSFMIVIDNFGKLLICDDKVSFSTHLGSKKLFNNYIIDSGSKYRNTRSSAKYFLKALNENTPVGVYDENNNLQYQLCENVTGYVILDTDGRIKIKDYNTHVVKASYWYSKGYPNTWDIM